MKDLQVDTSEQKAVTERLSAILARHLVFRQDCAYL